MNHVFIIFLALSVTLATDHQDDKSRYEKLKELVAKNLDVLGPMLTRGPPQELIDKYLNKEKVKKREKNRLELKKAKYAEQAKKMFFHAYNSYMAHAFPADELMPLSCKGRVRGLTQSRGEVDDALGRYMLTLVDSLDTLIVLNEYDVFEEAVKLVIRGLSFDTDITVNLFEANIRVLGGLLGGHSGCLYLQSLNKLAWYSNELLLLAVDLADRFLPAFDTPTGLPIPKINLRHGTHNIKDNETCTACAGTLYLEFAALSRYTGNVTYESVAYAALEFLYSKRVKNSDLPGSTMNVKTGSWVRKDTGVGAGIDSYYEYLLKGYLISGDLTLWSMFSTQYQAVRTHAMKRGYMLSVHATSPTNRVREHQDSLQAFWPGIQVLAGDIEEAAKVYNHYLKVSKANQNTLPEAFLLDGKMYWPQYYMRPELIESTYMLYQATRDPRYIEEAATIMNAIENRCKVLCGYAALKNTNTGQLEDRLDSFVLAETFKYLYLMFAEKEEIGVPIDDYVFSTEAHLIPLHLRFFSNEKITPSKEECENKGIYSWSWSEESLLAHYPTPDSLSHKMCFADEAPIHRRKKNDPPNASSLNTRTFTNGLTPANFDHHNPEHVATLRSMGISITYMEEDKIQLVHSSAGAYTGQLGVEGMIFMKEISEYTKQLSQAAMEQQNIQIKELFVQSLLHRETASFDAGKALFGPELTNGYRVAGTATTAQPPDGCSVIVNRVSGKIAILQRGGCMFVEKVRNAEQAGAVGAVVLDTAEGVQTPLAMSGDGTNDVTIPSLFITQTDGAKLLKLYEQDSQMLILELREPARSAQEDAGTE